MRYYICTWVVVYLNVRIDNKESVKAKCQNVCICIIHLSIIYLVVD